MGDVEQKVKERVKRVRIQDTLLLSLYGMGAVALALAAPNAVRLLRYADPYMKKKMNPSGRLQQATSRLVARGLLKWHVRDGKKSLQLTDKGKTYTERLVLENGLQKKKRQKWDKRWRLVSFDIWERHRAKRDRLRRLLHRVGFQRVHASLWVYPYDCEELIAFMRTDLHIGRGVLYFVADAIEGDERLHKHFKLPLD